MNNIKSYNVIVVGGGAAGIIAAWRSASLGVNTLLIEKNNKLGKKLLISGAGKCNITHSGSVDDLLAGFPKNEANFLKHSFYKFNNIDIINLLNSYGLKTYSREDGKIFPASNKSSDVLKVFEELLKDHKVNIFLNTTVTDIVIEKNICCGVKANSNLIESNSVIIATGGISYPHTGSTGDGYLFAQKTGHKIVELKPALAPVEVVPKFPAEWRGIALRNGLLSCYLHSKKILEEAGDVLFTHKGLSGPAVFEISRYIAEHMNEGNLFLYYDLLPLKSQEEINEELKDLIIQHPNQEVENILKKFFPNRIINYFLNLIYIEGSKRCNKITRSERNKIADLIKKLPLGKIDFIDIERGEVTAGGVSLKEVNSKTMESKKIKGLYFCGEVLDVAGKVGGYNLQAAYSTGYVAGESSA